MTTRLYLDFTPKDNIVTLDKKQINYLKNVLRFKNNTIAHIFNNRDGEYKAEYLNDNNNYYFKLLEQHKAFIKPKDLCLCYAPVKNVKSDFIAKKAAELGVTKLQPITTQYTIVRKINSDKLKLNMIEGIEQCGRVDLAEIAEISPLEKYIKHASKDDIIIFFDESATGKTPNQLQEQLLNIRDNKITILIGPEGGFSEKERSLINSLENSINISLGTRILRADTALIAACTLINSYSRNWE